MDKFQPHSNVSQTIDLIEVKKLFDAKLSALMKRIQDTSTIKYYGEIDSIEGGLIRLNFEAEKLTIGQICRIEHPFKGSILGEVIGFSNNKVLLMAYSDMTGLHPGTRVFKEPDSSSIYPSNEWMGRVIDAFASPVDGKSFLPSGTIAMPLYPAPISSHKRARVSKRIDVGIRAINNFLTCCAGQRIGIFAGSGVGKSILLSQLSQYTECDVCVIGLIGERGREVREFIEDVLGPEGLKKSVLVVATSDESALARRRAAHVALTVAEYFRNQGKIVLCLLDSVTRFAMSQREVGLNSGETATHRGYTPSVFSELSRLLERAGPGEEEKEQAGMMTAFFTVLVDGDDTNEPISDAVRGILDGHIILERNIAERGRYPAINILKSVSRMVPACLSDQEYQLIREAKKWLAIYDDMADLIRLGAYRKGADSDVDRAIELSGPLDDFLNQSRFEKTNIGEGFEALKKILSA